MSVPMHGVHVCVCVPMGGCVCVHTVPGMKGYIGYDCSRDPVPS